MTRPHTFAIAAAILAASALPALASTVTLQLIPCPSNPPPGSEVSVEVVAVRSGGYAMANAQYTLGVGGPATGGSYIAGGTAAPWFAYTGSLMPPPPPFGVPLCLNQADINCDGVLDSRDVILFEVAYVAHSGQADLNFDSQWTSLDLNIFWSAFVAGGNPGAPSNLNATFDALQRPSWATPTGSGGALITNASVSLGTFQVAVSPTATLGSSIVITANLLSSNVYAAVADIAAPSATVSGSTATLTVSPPAPSSVSLRVIPCTSSPAPGSVVSVEVMALRCGGAAMANAQYTLGVSGPATGGGYVAAGAAAPWFAYTGTASPPAPPPFGIPSCANVTDLNCDGVVDSADILYFEFAYVFNSPVADFNHDSKITPLDLVAFWSAFVVNGHPGAPSGLTAIFDAMQRPSWGTPTGSGGTLITDALVSLGTFQVTVSPTATIGSSIVITANLLASAVYAAAIDVNAPAATMSGGTATLTVTSAGAGGSVNVSIAQQPTSTRLCHATPSTVSVTAAGDGPYTFQWQIQTAPDLWAALTTAPIALPCGGMAHATNPTDAQTGISVAPCPGVTVYNVRCVVSNPCGSATSNSAVLTICSADITCNGFINVDDLLFVINQWGRCPGPPNPCPADIAPAAGNHAVNVDDLLAVINAWGPCP